MSLFTVMIICPECKLRKPLNRFFVLWSAIVGTWQAAIDTFLKSEDEIPCKEHMPRLLRKKP